METIKDLIGYEGIYKISNNGDIINNKGNKLKFSRSASGKGYYQVSLCKNGVVKMFSIHRLVAFNFLPLIEGKFIVNHKDGVKTNNNFTNLEWVTYSENIKHSIQVLGNPKPPSWKGRFGNNHNRSKKVYEFDLDFNLLNVYESGLDFQRKTNVSHTSAHWSIKNKKPIYNKYYSREPHFEL
jgi:hypothetical protein